MISVIVHAPLDNLTLYLGQDSPPHFIQGLPLGIRDFRYHMFPPIKESLKLPVSTSHQRSRFLHISYSFFQLSSV